MPDTGGFTNKIVLMPMTVSTVLSTHGFNGTPCAVAVALFSVRGTVLSTVCNKPDDVDC